MRRGNNSSSKGTRESEQWVIVGFERLTRGSHRKPPWPVETAPRTGSSDLSSRMLNERNTWRSELADRRGRLPYESAQTPPFSIPKQSPASRGFRGMDQRDSTRLLLAVAPCDQTSNLSPRRGFFPPALNRRLYRLRGYCCRARAGLLLRRVAAYSRAHLIRVGRGVRAAARSPLVRDSRGEGLTRSSGETPVQGPARADGRR